MTHTNRAGILGAAVALIFLCASAVYAEHVFMKDGKIIQGRISLDKKEGITLDLAGGMKKVIPRGDILRILYSDEYLTKSLVQLTTGETIEGFIVQEKRTELTIRKKLTDPVEQVIKKEQVQYTAKKRPSQLTARTITGGFLLKWTKPPGSFKKFVVYMKNEGGEYRVAGESATPDLKIRRGVLEGTTYQFKVRLVDEDNYESPPGNEITVTSLRKGEAPAATEEEVQKQEKPEPKKKEKLSLGIGPFGSAGIGMQSWDGKFVRPWNAGGGIMFDTALARDTLINYRTTVSFAQNYEYRYSKRPSLFTIPVSGGGYTARIYQTVYYRSRELVKPFSLDLASGIGFGVVRTPIVRFWLGPEYFLKLITTGSKRYLGLSAGLGLVLGLNINIGSLVTLAFSGSGRVMYSYRYSEYTSIDTSDFVEGSFVPAIPAYIQPDPRITLHQQDHGIGFGGQLNIAVLFRINDNYSPKAK